MQREKKLARWFLRTAVACTDCDYKRSAAAKRESRIHLDTGLDRCLDIMNQDCIRHSTLSTVREPHFRFSCSTRFSLTPNNHTDRDLDITYYDCIRYTLSEPQLQYKIQCQKFDPQPQSAYINPKILFHMRVVTTQWSMLSSVSLYFQVTVVLMIGCKNYIKQK